MLPLQGVHIGRNAEQGNSMIVFSGGITVVDDSINLASNHVYSSPSGSITTTLSMQPSFIHFSKVMGSNALNESIAPPEGVSELLDNSSYAQNLTTALLGIQGVKYEFQHYSRYTYSYRDYWVEEVCPLYRHKPHLLSQTLLSTTYDGNFTIGEIVHVNLTGGLEVFAHPVSIWDAWVMQHYLLLDSNGGVQLNVSGSGSGYQSSTIWAKTYGWTNAVKAYREAEHALDVFPAPISLGLAITATSAAASSSDFDAASIVTVAGGVIARIISLAPKVLGQFSSVGFISGKMAMSSIWGLSNNPLFGSGSNYTMSFYESPGRVMFTLPVGNSYFFYAPEDYLNATAIT
jgi:hypothetical protein